ncbi:hypothetical protein EGW08_015168 [Elysia chlorotica]|uniref:AMP-dependent synthetase/ligase domain-containing protein n=1 Tax=Elysia chlorotica TaxID=188477 RepID=A0A433T690_ELYCH|nr:hypothetical protein EGW08_015168 [Elysia chlorotica]
MAHDEMTWNHKLQELSRTMPQLEAVVTYDEAMVRSSLNMEELYTLSARFAYLLKQEGVLPGDYVVTTVPMSLEATIILFGTLFAGAVPASLEITFRDGEALMQCMTKLRSRHMIVQDEPWSEVLKFCKSKFEISFHPGSIWADVTSPRMPCLERMMLIKRSGGRNQSFIELLRASDDEYIYEGITPESVGWFCFTTGTETDYIRMTEFSHKTAITIGQLMHQCKVTVCRNRLYENPWFWVSSIPGDILNGKTRVMPDKWRIISDYPLMLVKLIQTEGVEMADIQPLNVKPMLELLDSYTDGKPLLKHLECGGMPVTRSHMEALRPLASRFSIIYGSHELGIISMNVLTAEEIQDFPDYDNGTLAPGVKMRLVDSNGQDVEPGQKGRILVKSPCMFRGYPNEPDRTAARFNKDNWFMSYDQARIEQSNGHVFSGGRIDVIILHGQYMLFPCWLEAMVAPHPAVKKVVSVPFSDVVLFHAIGICIIKHPGASLTKEEVTELILSHVVPGKEFLIRPKAVLFFDKFPTKPDGTVDKPRLSDIVAEHINNGIA